MTHDELKALLPLAALERLEPEEVAALREHLAGCAECDAELREFEHAMAMFALALDAPAKEDRVMRKLEARLAAPTPTTPNPNRRLRRNPRHHRRRGSSSRFPRVAMPLRDGPRASRSRHQWCWRCTVRR
jgi:anti-sigma factor RsiW